MVLLSETPAERTCTHCPFGKITYMSHTFNHYYSIVGPISLSFHSHNGQVRHYLINYDGSKYYVSKRYRFDSVKMLIEYHKLNRGEVVIRLRKPPHQLVPQLSSILGKWLEICPDYNSEVS